MIFSKNSRKAPHLLSLLVAFAVAVGMWYVVSVRDRLEVQLEVGIEYNGIPSGLVVTDGLVSKVQVRLRGPEGVISSINNLPLGIRLDPKAAGTTVEQTLLLDTPSLVTSNPASVKVQYTITSGRTVVSRRCRSRWSPYHSKKFTVEPSHVEVMVEVPEALARNSSYLKRLEVMVVPPALEPGQKGTAEPRIQLPEGMTILNPSFDSVTITRKK